MVRALEIPPKITPAGDDGYFEELTKAIFRAGFNWRVVREKWENFRISFHGFDIRQVAGYDENEIARLFADASIIRNRRKILSTVENARTMLMLIADHGSFQEFLRSLDPADYYQRVRVLTGLFAGLGRTGAFVFLHCVNEQTPEWQMR